MDENGLITQEGMERIAVIAEEQDTPSSADYTGLFDFDRDGVPEVYFVRHNAGQGPLLSKYCSESILPFSIVSL